MGSSVNTKTHPLSFFLKFAIVLFVSLSFRGFAAADTFTGFLGKSSSNSDFSLKIDDEVFTVLPLTQEVKKTLTRLQSGDRIQLKATREDKRLLVQEILFVGLKRLVGLWISESSALNFPNYQDLFLFATFRRHNIHSPLKFQYTLSPADHDKWVMIFSEEKSARTEIAVILVEFHGITVDYIIDEKTVQRVQYSRVF